MSPAEKDPNLVGVYHEKQVRELCALHAINNLLQRRQFGAAQLNAICERLAPAAWVNPHRSLLGTGNFDVNVLIAALQQLRLDVKWFDRRRSVSDIVLENVEGFIMNLLSEYRLGPFTLPYSRRHWVAIRRLPSSGHAGHHGANTLPSSGTAMYYNLDSKLDSPQRIGTGSDLVTYLTDKLNNCSDVELFVVVGQSTAEGGTWIRPATVATPSGSSANLQCHTTAKDGAVGS